jgi:hypothetical protein
MAEVSREAQINPLYSKSYDWQVHLGKGSSANSANV